MAAVRCANCGSEMARDDAFCGACGTRAMAIAATQTIQRTWPAANDRLDPEPAPAPVPPVAAAPPPAAAPPQPERDGPGFFAHASRWPTGPLNNVTRYLCAAAYLDPAFANVVISELVASHRAVVPSLGMDVLPVIRHCLRARRMQLIRDVILTILLAIGLFFATVPVIGILVLGFVLGRLPGAHWERRSVGSKALAVTGLVLILGVAVIGWFVLRVFSQANGFPKLGALAIGAAVIGVVLLDLLLMAVTLIVYSSAMFRTFAERLAPGAEAGQFDRSDVWVESRLAQIDAAQRGNVTLYSGENPFIGTGRRARSWSLAVELNRAPRNPGSVSVDASIPGDYVPIDPIELHDAIRARLLGLRDPQLPANERIDALTVGDYVVGEGVTRWDSPLIDPELKIPYSRATDEAVGALICHPQAGLRYYQRAFVSDEGLAVWVGNRQVIGRTDQEVGVTAFVYVAVEGRMLYLEFDSAVLPPIRSAYHAIDHMPKISSGRFIAKVLLQAASTASRDLLHAPFGVIEVLSRRRAERKAVNEEIAISYDNVYGDVGALLSVRELGAAGAPRTYIQRLDAAKYTKIVERVVINTVSDFLGEKGVDTREYRAGAQNVLNAGNVIYGGNFYGQVSGTQSGDITNNQSEPKQATASA